MKPVHQTEFVVKAEDGSILIPGNCFSACIASMLGLPLEDVPTFVAFPNWLGLANEFVKSFGFELFMSVPRFIEYCRSAKDSGYHGYYIATGMGPRGVEHAVICKDGQIVHDPHPEGGGIDKPTSVFVFLAVDPSMSEGSSL